MWPRINRVEALDRWGSTLGRKAAAGKTYGGTLIHGTWHRPPQRPPSAPSRTAPSRSAGLLDPAGYLLHNPRGGRGRGRTPWQVRATPQSHVASSTRNDVVNLAAFGAHTRRRFPGQFGPAGHGCHPAPSRRCLTLYPSLPHRMRRPPSRRTCPVLRGCACPPTPRPSPRSSTCCTRSTSCAPKPPPPCWTGLRALRTGGGKGLKGAAAQRQAELAPTCVMRPLCVPLRTDSNSGTGILVNVVARTSPVGTGDAIRQA